MAHRSVRRMRVAAAATLAGVLLLSACSSSSESSTSTTASTAAGSGATGSSAPGTTAGSSTGGTTPGTTAGRPLRILVTNDDGYAAPGIDAVVEGLQTLPDVEVVVVAPAENQSGSGPKTTDGPLTATEVTTASGYPATAVQGFPADSVVWALDQDGIDDQPDLVVSGINAGQNLGPVLELSGTVGAARAASTRGIPAIAASLGLANDPDYDPAVELVLEWITEHRAELLAGTDETPAEVVNLNIPSCATGTLGELVEVTYATDPAGRNVLAADIDCTGQPAAPTDDVEAFLAGFPSLTVITPGS